MIDIEAVSYKIPFKSYPDGSKITDYVLYEYFEYWITFKVLTLCKSLDLPYIVLDTISLGKVTSNIETIRAN